MDPGFPTDDTANGRLVDAKLPGDVLLCNGLGGQGADLPDLIFGEFMVASSFPSEDKMKSRPVGMKAILTLCYPFEIFKVVICLVPVFVIAFLTNRIQTTEGNQYEAVDCRYPSLLRSGMEKNMRIPTRVEGSLENLASVSAPALLHPLDTTEI